MITKSAKKIVIAHRGASGYLPENTLEAKVLAYGMGADFIEQDVVLTKDDVPIVMHDIYLDTTTDVAEKFPDDRARKDGRYYAIDFELEDIRKLNVTERIDPKEKKVKYPNRFPVGKSAFKIHTLIEEVELIKGLNKSTGRDVGIYPEIKHPAWHRKQGKEISEIVLGILKRYDYVGKNSNVYLQCFDDKELKRIHDKSDLKLIQLLAESIWGEEYSGTDYNKLKTNDGLQYLAEYAYGIGPWIGQIREDKQLTGEYYEVNPLVKIEDVKKAGLAVHPYTLRADELPSYANSLEELLHIFYFEEDVDGLFTDFPDTAVRYLNRPDKAIGEKGRKPTTIITANFKKKGPGKIREDIMTE